MQVSRPTVHIKSQKLGVFLKVFNECTDVFVLLIVFNKYPNGPSSSRENLETRSEPKLLDE